MPASIAPLLHMHQPDYRDPQSGEPIMPWVRLHATRGYTDVPVLLAESGAVATVNVVPSLLEQLADYAAGATDRWERLSRVPAEDLDADQVAFIRKHFFHGNVRMRRCSARLTALEEKVTAEAPLTPQELRDVQVWSNLAWMGVVARRTELVSGLRVKGENFTHGELLALMNYQRELVAGVLPLWRRLPSLSCTPHYHPILPLLVNFEHARRSLTIPADDDVAFSWPEDARRHLVEGRETVQRILGRRPQGLWPSEGAVSPEAMVLAKEAGFSWFVTDQAQLQRADRSGKPDIRRPWRVAGGPLGLFRDQVLSDRISFDYQHWDGADAAADLIARVDAGGPDGVVVLALDGENPWEAYPDAGEGFMRAFFGSGRCVGAEVAAAQVPAGEVHRLHTGSWIGGTLGVWAGDASDRRAWRLVAAAREAWEDAGKPEAAWRHLAAAEGSDWFWWFGPEFHSEEHALFDGLFRTHLRAAWQAMGRQPPAELMQPVGGER